MLQVLLPLFLDENVKIIMSFFLNFSLQLIDF